LVGQLLAAPTRSLRDAAGEDDWETIRTALHLFDPEFDAPPEIPGEDGTGPMSADAPADAPPGAPFDAATDFSTEEVDD
ncbi:hypothetical protein ACFQEU_12010, partial [Halorubrum tibetense]